MRIIFKSLILVSALISVVGCYDKRCGINKQPVQEIQQPNIEVRLDKVKKETGGK